AFTLWGFLGGAPEDLVAFRRPLFQSAGHHYLAQLEISSRVPEATLRLTPALVRERLAEWRSLIDATVRPRPQPRPQPLPAGTEVGTLLG
ncbi:MAG: hypothetical protein ACRDZQ_01375, partial [Acidimicrobiales bacterium]